MKKWNYAIECWLPSLLLYYGYSAYDINSEVCLEKSFAFALGDKGCSFTLAEAKQWFKEDTSSCPRQCLVKINNLEERESRWSSETKYQLAFIALSIKGFMDDFKRIERECRFSYKEKRTLEIICKTNSEILDMSTDLCTLTQNCTEDSKTCLLTGQIGICICKPGYIGFENKCLQGNLKLNETCQRDEQCSVAFGSVCLNGTCVCRPGYVRQYSECFQTHSDGNLQAIIQDQKEENTVSVTIGAVFGGLILGIVLTVVVGNIYQHIRYGKLKTKDNSRAAVFNNATYETETDVLQNNLTEHRINERKVVNVPPFAHSDDSQNNRNVQKDIKNSPENIDVNNNVYNHLHEKEENSDIVENYDHAHGNINREIDESDYSNLYTGRRYMESDVSVSEDNYYDVRESARQVIIFH
ncbi:uncharacterized protein LOC134262089 isoform X3 [Saccostrea cucullata]|uniref:uncharacterized protein LOC134262089 isoform X3 n=1 Tax=Saccostrea cuccullata TaxID=36930 RepID=UPI002ED4A0F1